MTRSQCVNRMIDAGLSFVQAQFAFHNSLALLGGADRAIGLSEIVNHRELVETFSADEDRTFDYEMTRLHRGCAVRGRSL